MLKFVENKCWHLTSEEQQQFIKAFRSWEQPLKCTLVRICNRKSPFIDISKFSYPEIEDLDNQLYLLENFGLISPVPGLLKTQWLRGLTKPDLFQALKAADKPLPLKSAKKAEVLAAAEIHLTDTPISQFPKFTQYKYAACTDLIEYFRFLFFGSLNKGHEQFSMRDLGVMRTRKDDQHGELPYANIDAATNSYLYKKQLQSLKQEGCVLTQHLERWRKLPEPVTEHDKAIWDAYLFELGKLASQVSIADALAIWEASEDPRSVEKWCRETYKLGDKEGVEQKLLNIIKDPACLDLAEFATDFYQLKYHKQKYSKATQLLLNAQRSVELDEAHLGSPEQGVQQLWTQQGKTVYRTENRLWRSLFGLAFFQLLYKDPQNKPANAFNSLPVALVQNTFFENSESAINEILAYFERPEQAVKYLTKMALQFFGEKNAIFTWSQALLERLTAFLQVAPAEAVKAFLLAMCKNYSGLKDGYPDLMVIEDGQLAFVEIKAENDVIRRNQIRTINHLQSFGFDVEIATVQWNFNPEQKYSVVDIETTGGQSKGHRITEIGIATVQNGKIVDTWNTLINPGRHIPAHITRLTGISNEMVEGAPLFAEIAEALKEQLSGTIFVAHNVNFDFGFIKMEYERLEQYFSMPKLCTVREMRKHFPGHSSYSLGALCKAYDLQLDNHHRALDDAIAAAQLLLMVHGKKLDTALPGS